MLRGQSSGLSCQGPSHLPKCHLADECKLRPANPDQYADIPSAYASTEMVPALTINIHNGKKRSTLKEGSLTPRECLFKHCIWDRCEGNGVCLESRKGDFLMLLSLSQHNHNGVDILPTK